MKIVHTESSLGWGGQEIRVLQESRHLVDLGHEVSIVCDSESLISGRHCNLAPNVEVIKTRIKKKRLPDLLSVRSVLKSLAPDLVVCHSSTDHWLTAVSRETLGAKFPIIRMRHISAPINPNSRTRWLFTGGCESIISTGTGISQAIVEGGLASHAKVSSIPTGLDPLAFGRLCKEEARKRLGLRLDPVLIGIVATLRSWKGHDDLITAFSQLDNDTELLVVGDGPRASALRDLTKSLGLDGRVKFVGHQENVSEWLSALDIFVQPSYANEGVPQAILQAMATGLPIVSCPIGGIPEAVAHYGAASLVPPRSPALLAQALRHTTSKLNQLPSRESLRFVPFSSAEMARQCESLYRRTIDEFSNR